MKTREEIFLEELSEMLFEVKPETKQYNLTLYENAILKGADEMASMVVIGYDNQKEEGTNPTKWGIITSSFLEDGWQFKIHYFVHYTALLKHKQFETLVWAMHLNPEI